MLPKYNHTLCLLQQMEWIIPQDYILTEQYGRKQSLQNPIRHLYLKLSEMWHLFLEWIKKFHFPKAEYSCWFDTHTQKQMSMLYPPICQQPNTHHQSRPTTIWKRRLLLKLLFPQLTCNVNKNCLWQEMNTESVLLTFTIFGFSGGCTLFSRRAHQSTPLKNGCSLTPFSRP